MAAGNKEHALVQLNSLQSHEAADQESVKEQHEAQAGHKSHMQTTSNGSEAVRESVKDNAVSQSESTSSGTIAAPGAIMPKKDKLHARTDSHMSESSPSHNAPGSAQPLLDDAIVSQPTAVAAVRQVVKGQMQTAIQSVKQMFVGSSSGSEETRKQNRQADKSTD